MEDILLPALARKRTAMPVVPEAARVTTININSIGGGHAECPPDFTGWPAPVLPDRCRMIIDRRFLAEEPIAAVKAEFSLRSRWPASGAPSPTRSATCTRSSPA